MQPPDQDLLSTMGTSRPGPQQQGQTVADSVAGPQPWQGAADTGTAVGWGGSSPADSAEPPIACRGWWHLGLGLAWWPKPASSAQLAPQRGLRQKFMDLVKRHYGQSMPQLLQRALSTPWAGVRQVLVMGSLAAWEVRPTHTAGAPQPCTHPTPICNVCLFPAVNFYNLL